MPIGDGLPKSRGRKIRAQESGTPAFFPQNELNELRGQDVMVLTQSGPNSQRLMQSFLWESRRHFGKHFRKNTARYPLLIDLQLSAFPFLADLLESRGNDMVGNFGESKAHAAKLVKDDPATVGLGRY